MANSIQYPSLPPELSGRINWRMLKYFGAGAIIASVTIGSGETVFASRGGAVFGYALLWCFVGGTIMKGIQVYTAARHITLTGEHPMTHWALLPGPRCWVPLLIGVLSLLCFPFWLAGLPRMLGGLINWIFGLGGQDAEQFTKLARVWGSIAIIIASTLTLLQSYKILETVQTIIVGILLVSVMAACFAVRPDWLSALAGLAPTVPANFEDWVVEKYPKDFANTRPWIEMVVYLGAIGGGTYDYIGYIGCMREKKWGALGSAQPASAAPTRAQTLDIDTSENNMRRARRWLIPAGVDIGIGFLCVLVFTICFVLLGAVVLHPQQTAPAGQELFNHQAQFLTQFHPGLLYLYQVGIFIAFWGTIYGAYEIYARTTYECLRPLGDVFRSASMKLVRFWTVIYCAAGGLALLWIVDDPVSLVKPAAIVGGVLTCGLWCFFMIWTDRHFLPRPLQMSKTLLVLTIISGTVMTVLGLYASWDYVSGLW